MTVRMIVAADQGNSIGWANGELPWKITPDMERFKSLTMGSTVVMGRTTFNSLKRPNGLPNRRNIVLTRQPWSDVRGQFQGTNVEVISSLDFVRDVLQEPKDGVVPDVWVIGGASVYGEAIEKKIVDEVYFTAVHTLSGGDVVLPFDLYGWKLFILCERARGVFWEAEIQNDVPTPPGLCPKISYITFRKSAISGSATTL